MVYIYSVAGILWLALAIAATLHALLNKRDPRAALGWIATCVMFPLVGPLLYYTFGNNRIRTRALKLEHRWQRTQLQEPGQPHAVPIEQVPSEYAELTRISRAVTGQLLVRGNSVELLHNGEQAFPAMLEAIRNAKQRVYLATYIFETNATGREFIEALAQAKQRGVEVRLLVDGIGNWYSFPRASSLARRHGVPVARFLPPRLIPPTLLVNLRNHRKMLVVDGCVAFSGGMNIGDRHLVQVADDKDRVQDLHFRLAGPIVPQIEQVFVEDWNFATQEGLPLPTCSVAAEGDAICRTIIDGPNEDLDKLIHVLAGAVSSARSRVRIITPYFIPPRELIAALQAAALRGVQVEVILPERNNLPLVHWASRNLLWELLERDVNIYYQPPPFAHTKLFIVDDHYTQLGSANLDPRSLRLNFELTVEVYGRAFSKRVADYFDEVRSRSRAVTLQDMDARTLPIRLRDSIAWLFSPYL